MQIDKMSERELRAGMNADRERRAYAALQAYRRETRTDEDDALADLLCDLQHWASRNGYCFQSELERADMYFEAETGET